LQIGDPNTIAELTGITTVADFRRRDLASGGEGAPLAPAFHAAAFAAAGVNRAIVNIGGIANLSVLDGTTLVAGFDTGPGNTLLDHWIARHLGATHDDKGRWAARAQVIPALLDALLEHPHFESRGPRSTGKEAFNLDWLDSVLAQLDPQEPDRVQSTLAEFTARTIAREVALARPAVAEVYVCGGGSHNDDLMNRLGRHLPGLRLDSTEPLGIDPDWVEAAAFAWLASRTLAGLPGNSPAVTGAAGPRILGAIYPG
jgi:anhydro-N-acetylmuramic acid kinase